MFVRDIIEDASKNVVPEVYAKRRLWMNMPTGQGDLVGGYPGSLFNNDTFSMWNYVNLYGAWNHSPFQAPVLGRMLHIRMVPICSVELNF